MYAHLHRCVVVVVCLVSTADVPAVLFELLQTVQHCLSEQLASSGCSPNTAFTWNRPQLLHTGVQPGQVTTNLLKTEKKG